MLLGVEQQILPQSNFIQLFAEKFNEVLSERMIKAMKHAIEVAIFSPLFSLSH